MNNRRAFLAVELLAFLAIVSVLAMIGLHRYQTARRDALFSEASADVTELRTAIEAYHVDYTTYPRHTWGCFPYDDRDSSGTRVYITAPKALTTPVAYMATVKNDVYRPAEPYTYHNNNTGAFLFSLSPATNCFSRVPYTNTVLTNFGTVFGPYHALSIGPDGALGSTSVVFPPPGTAVMPYAVQYDPTNGATSQGNIYRTNAFTGSTSVEDWDSAY